MMNILAIAAAALAGVNAAGEALGSYTANTGTRGIVDNGRTIVLINVPVNGAAAACAAEFRALVPNKVGIAGGMPAPTPFPPRPSVPESSS